MLLAGDRKLQEQPVFGGPAGVAEQEGINKAVAAYGQFQGLAGATGIDGLDIAADDDDDDEDDDGDDDDDDDGELHNRNGFACRNFLKSLHALQVSSILLVCRQ
jgi:hypothetical protein